MVYNKSCIGFNRAPTGCFSSEKEQIMANKKYYITTAIAYTSGKPHIGNTYEAILADAIARFKRKQGYDVFFQTGTDEHGQKIEEKAAAAGVTPQAFVDGVAGTIQGIWDMVGTSYDKFVRTTDPEHCAQVAKIFKKFYEQGDIYKSEYVGMYCTPCESFWTESQLVEGKCPDCGREVKPAKEEAYFFKMGKYADRLIEHIEKHPEFIQPVSRKNEMMNNFLKKGLQDLCVSRTSFKWGIPVDFDDRHVVYVWLDALTNYITGIGFDADGNHGENYRKYWPADLHLIGKDILRFHTIYWPIFLMAMGEPLPKQIFGHPWLLQGEGKMSKSKGNVIYADDLARLFGVDAVRYFVLHEMPFDNDGQITWELVCERFNTELANVLGNLVSRTIAMMNKYFGGKVVASQKANEEDPDSEFKATVCETVKKVEDKMELLRVADAISEIFNTLRRANKYIDETMPWALAKDESKQARLNDVLYNLVDTILTCASLLESFMPETAKKIFAAFGVQAKSLEECAIFGQAEAYSAEPVPALFQRLDFKALEPEIEAIAAAQKASVKAAEPAPAPTESKEEAPKKAEIAFEDFEKVELRVGEIIACEAVPKSSKLLKETVKFGDEIRTVVSGIAKHYKPEEMVGKKVVFVTNLAPRKICGILSEGMILAAEDEDGKLSLCVSDKDDLKSGANCG
ncbi:MAG: methionine--tRNA ligase [Clostridiales bacterium]|nr:methionine--tRNA ligase [Clostridiales bacterium]